MINKIRNDRSAFTLVEIMIVVAIIGLLAALAVPGFVKARKQSQGRRILNDCRQQDAAIDQWALETGQTDGATVNTTGAATYLKTDVEVAGLARVTPSGLPPWLWGRGKSSFPPRPRVRWPVLVLIGVRTKVGTQARAHVRLMFELARGRRAIPPASVVEKGGIETGVKEDPMRRKLLGSARKRSRLQKSCSRWC